MSNSDNKIYLYEDNIDVVMTTDDFYVDNRPMNTRHLKVHKGVSNEIIFTVRNRDRKLQNVAPDTVRAYIVDPSNNSRLVTRILQNTLDLGKLKLILLEGDIQDIQPGLYHMYLTRSTSELDNTPFYSDQNNNMRFNLEITDQSYASPVPTQVQNTFVQTSSTTLGDEANIFVTNALYGNLEKNFPNATHTAAFYLDGYTGNITVQASCMRSTPDLEDQSTDWFDVNTTEIANANVTIAHTNFQVNCNWIRVVSEPLTGNITQVLLRN
jgi:hypothetical protein